MKKIVWLGFLVLIILCAAHVSTAQNKNEMSTGYYVVVAAFSPKYENYAARFVSSLSAKGIESKYGFNSERGFYYVYVHFSTNREPSLVEMAEMRKKNGFEKTWIRIVGHGPSNEVEEEAIVQPAVEAKKEPILEPEKNEPQHQPATELKIADEAGEKVVLDSIIAEGITVDAVPTDVFLNLFNATNNRIVEGKVKVVETEKAKLITEQNGNDFLDLDAKRKPGTITLICEAFGYRKVQQEINYPLTVQDTVREYVDLVGPTFIINFDLVRYNKGDIATLYQVYFYNDAAIMLPESKFELNSLLQMMQENPGYRIRLHGHTNGNYHGRIILLGENKNFFALEGSRNANGSAKELSEARADIIKQYLVANGIADSRVEVKAWGGKRPIYDKNSANAKKNVRVEVEILEDK